MANSVYLIEYIAVRPPKVIVIAREYITIDIFGSKLNERYLNKVPVSR